MGDAGTATTKPFRVIIVGAGIVGLSLSHALQLAQIDHVVLEKYDRVKSLKGAALILWPNAERIFDQFGFLSKILESTTPVRTEHQRWPGGTINGNRSMMLKFEELYVDSSVELTEHTNLDTASRSLLSSSIDRLAWLTSMTTSLISQRSS